MDTTTTQRRPLSLPVLFVGGVALTLTLALVIFFLLMRPPVNEITAVAAFLVLAIVPMSTISFIAINGTRQDIRKERMSRLTAVATLKEAQIQQWIAERNHSLAVLSNKPDVQRAATTLLTQHPSNTAYDAAYASLRDSLHVELTQDTGFAGFFLTWPAAASRLLTPTPRQTAGPFYPTQLPLDDDNDLTRVRGSRTPANGHITDLFGRIMDLQAQTGGFGHLLIVSYDATDERASWDRSLQLLMNDVLPRCQISDRPQQKSIGGS